MSPGGGRIILAAGDDGPKSTLRPLAGAVQAVLADTAATEVSYWTQLICSHLAQGLVCGTSDSAAGRAVEASARRAATNAGIPAVAIEDFPGNYYDVPDGPVAMLIVESEPVATFTRAKFGAICPRLEVLSPARYDRYRSAAPSLRAQVLQRWAESGRDSRLILWAGQPETGDCVRTLRCLLPLVRAHELTLLFKAHPRDAGYSSGTYQALFAGFEVPYRDATGLTVPEALLLAPHLVVTQFSSVAIEAGFYGIPSMSILLSDVGGARLLAKKGYPVPPYCECGGAACVTGVEELPEAFSRALGDQAQRKNIMRCFDAYFRTADPMLPPLIALLESVFESRQIFP